MKKSAETLSLYSNGREFGKDGFWKYSEQDKVHSENGVISNRGVELSLGAVPVRTKSVNWEIGVAASFNSNLVKSVDFNQKQIDPISGTWLITSPEGYRAGKLIGYLRDNDGNPTDLTGDGKITEADLTILGNTLPTTLVNISSRLQVCGFSLKGQVGMRYGCDCVDFKTGSIQPDTMMPFQVSASYDINIGRTVLRPFVSADNGLPSSTWYLAQRHVAVLGGLNFKF